jgi:lipoprotein-anchoring transpeptidase ErfK/SrfK
MRENLPKGTGVFAPEVFCMTQIRIAVAAAILALAVGLGTAPAALADRVLARVSISKQMMEVWHEGRKLYEWPVSTARSGKVTPVGQWKGAQWLSRHHRSSLYNNAPMPYAIFYNGNYAIHGTDQVRKLGRPASAGCVRLEPSNARILFDMVRYEGKENLRVVVVR